MSTTPDQPDPGADFPLESDPLWKGLSPGDLRAQFNEKVSAPERLASIDRMAQAVHQHIDRLADGASEGVRRAQRGMTQASDVWRVQSRQLREAHAHWTACAREEVRAKPLTAVAAALVAGVVLAELCRRR
jgi:ElaB/YqjD/DUF883 family membrane-anchored ribosome-binding protein